MNESPKPSSDRTIRVRRSVANMMAESRPADRTPWSLVVAILLLLAGGWAGWHWRDAWFPRARAWVESFARPTAVEPAGPEAPADVPGDLAVEVLPPPPAPEPAVPEAGLPEAPALPDPVALPPDAPAAPPAGPVPAAPSAAAQAPADSPAALFNAALRDYQTFLGDKAAHADLLPSIENRARKAAKGFEQLLPVVSSPQQPQINEALSQCYRLISDCRRQNTSAARDLSAPATSGHAEFNRATVGPKRRPALPAAVPAPPASTPSPAP